ncbi:conserved exported hypothetical protein [Alteromonas infernus]|tara:strand:- start:2293 stop:3468 length:1176 start_codon:yes stop_codon:yes gene_type:complete
MKKTITFALWLMSSCAAASHSDFSWHGYVAQGVTQSKGSSFMTDDDKITGELTEIGLNGYYQLAKNVSIAGQINYLDGGNRFEQGARLDYLFVDWKLPDLSENWRGQIHIGRYKNKHWLYSVTRDVPQTRYTSVLPQSVYFDGFRDVALGSNGIQANFSHLGSHYNWDLNWSYGRSHINDTQRDFLLGSDANGKIKQDFVHQASVFLQPSSLTWKVGASWLNSDFRYTPSLNDNRLSGEANIERLMLSAQYFAENWEVSAEVLREIQDSKGLFAPDFAEKRRGEGGFVQFRYLFNNDLSGLIGFDTYVNDVSDRQGKQLEALSGGTIPAYFGYQDTYTIGLRWDIAPKWRLQGEYHWVEGATRVVSLLNRDVVSHADKYWEMWSLQLMYWF